jgi:hypothetical protein
VIDRTSGRTYENQLDGTAGVQGDRAAVVDQGRRLPRDDRLRFEIRHLLRRKVNLLQNGYPAWGQDCRAAVDQPDPELVATSGRPSSTSANTGLEPTISDALVTG